MVRSTMMKEDENSRRNAVTASERATAFASYSSYCNVSFHAASAARLAQIPPRRGLDRRPDRDARESNMCGRARATLGTRDVAAAAGTVRPVGSRLVPSSRPRSRPDVSIR